MARLLVLAAGLLGICSTLTGQTWIAHVPIGKYLPTNAPESRIAVSADGKLIAFVEQSWPRCSGYSHRIAVMNSDGTGYRVLVPYEVIQSLTGSPMFNTPQ